MPAEPTAPDPGAQCSKHDLLRTLRHAGFTPEVIKRVDAEFPETIDVQRDGDALAQYGITYTHLEDLLGGSP